MDFNGCRYCNTENVNIDNITVREVLHNLFYVIAFVSTR